MKYRWDKKYLHWGMTAFLVFAACLGLYYVVFHGASLGRGFNRFVTIAMPILDGFVLAYLMNPILNGIERSLLVPLFQRCGAQLDETASPKAARRNRTCIRGIAICLTLALVFTAVYAFFAMVIPQLADSIRSIVVQFPGYTTRITRSVEKMLADNPDVEAMAISLMGSYSDKIEQWLNHTLLPQMNTALRVVSLSLLGIVKALWNLIIGLIISIYLLCSKETFAGQGKKMLYAFFQTGTANVILHNLRFTHRTFSGFISGKILDSVIIGILCFAGTSLIGTPYPVLISVIIGVTNVIPFFGPYFGAVPSALFILMINPMQCLYFVIFVLLLQQFDGNVLGPKILGGSTGLSGFWVIFSITLFGGLYGVFGMIIGVPAFAVFYAAVRTWVHRLLKKKNLPIQTQQYLQVSAIRNQKLIVYPQAELRRKRWRRGKARQAAEEQEQPAEQEEPKNNGFVIDDEDC